MESSASVLSGSAVEFLSEAGNTVHATVVPVSTDFVFGGGKRAPYEVNDPTGPLSAYGRSKLVGEHAATHARKHVVVRTAWLFGVHGPNFVEAIRRQVTLGTNPLRVVNDQCGRPTYAPHLAAAFVRIARLAPESHSARGIAHHADQNESTWC